MLPDITELFEIQEESDKEHLGVHKNWMMLLLILFLLGMSALTYNVWKEEKKKEAIHMLK